MNSFLKRIITQVLINFTEKLVKFAESSTFLSFLLSKKNTDTNVEKNVGIGINRYFAEMSVSASVSKKMSVSIGIGIQKKVGIGSVSVPKQHWSVLPGPVLDLLGPRSGPVLY